MNKYMIQNAFSLIRIELIEINYVYAILFKRFKIWSNLIMKIMNQM